MFSSACSKLLRQFDHLGRLHSRLRRRKDAANGSFTHNPLGSRLLDVFLRTWDLGLTGFGGPPVHFQIFYQRFVEHPDEKKRWVDKQTYQEIFATCQGLPGPASTKMLFCLTLLHAGFLPALMAFAFWSLPGAIAMFGLALGVQRIDEILPLPVYALLSGLNSSTVGIIALAAVQLADKAIKDKLTRIIVLFGACAGLCHNALWYFPAVMTVGGLSVALWDGWLAQVLRRIRLRFLKRPNNIVDQADKTRTPAKTSSNNDAAMVSSPLGSVVQRRLPIQHEDIIEEPESFTPPLVMNNMFSEAVHSQENKYIPLKIGLIIVVVFTSTFAAVMVARGVIKSLPLTFNLFSNMFLAGTIIFGGGPVVIPLLRSYVVDPGWVSSRDFLLGLAIIQSLPGPNFNFAVYLGALALQDSSSSIVLGAVIAFLAIFSPGLTLAVAVQSFWKGLRKRKWVLDLLRGLNAAAVGLVFTAVYRLWEIGYLTPQESRGQSLARDPWWVVVAVIAYSGSAWFRIPPPVAIILGGALGLCWYGAVAQRHGFV